MMAAASNAPQSVQRKRGYRRLAEFMAWDPATAIFPRFQVANLHNLLLMQAEISELEEQFSDAVNDDDNSNGENRKYSCDWSSLKQEGATSPQWRTCQALRTKLAEYSMGTFHRLMYSILQKTSTDVFRPGSCSPNIIEQSSPSTLIRYGSTTKMAGGYPRRRLSIERSRFSYLVTS